MEMETETIEIKAKTMFAPAEDELDGLGLKAASVNLKTKRDLKRKLGIAYEYHRFVTPEQIAKFTSELYSRTNRTLPKSKEHPWGGQAYDTLTFTPLENYLAVPPREALDKLKEAQDRKVFDKFEVCTVESVTKLNDPIIFGIVEGCSNKFAICDWDDDVRISDLLKDDEG